MMDTITWRWQCELEAAEHRQHIRVTDCFGAAWTEQAKEYAWLAHCLQAPVGSSCTPLTQPTDTHLAKPAKDAASVAKETA